MGGSQGIQQEPYSIEIPGTKRPGSSSIYVSPKARPYFFSNSIKATTLYELFQMSCEKYADRPFLGTRKKEQTGFGPYEWVTYRETQQKSQRIGWGLSQIGLTEESIIGIYSKNRLEWLLIEHACISQNITSVPIYDTLQPDAFEYIAEQTLMKAVACNTTGTDSVFKLKEEGKLQSIQIVILFEEPTPEIKQKSEKVGLKIYSLPELELTQNGKDNPPNPDSLFTICYTSGTTGRGKGAMILHKNVMASIKGLKECGHSFNQNDCYISYLPLAHIMERVGIHNLYKEGVAIGFYQGDIMKLREDITELKPTLFATVPRFFNRIYDLIHQQIREASWTKRQLIEKAIASKIFYLNTTGAVTHKLWDTLVFNKVKNILGGKIRRMAVGGAPMSAEVLSFFKIAFMCEIGEGYGQTETSSAAFLTKFTEKKAGIVGGPSSVIEYRIEDIPEMNYFNTDLDANGNPAPRGEICLRGPSIFSGYFKSPELTREAFDEEGWLHTGDVGVRNFDDGSLSIIDRKKSIFKLQQGEYVSQSKIELAYLKCPFVAQIFVYGESLQSYLIAVVVPDEAFVRKIWAGQNGLGDSNSFEEICRSEKLRKDVLDGMDRVAAQERFAGFEYVKKIHLEPKLWTPNDILTPTSKLISFKAKQRYQEVIHELYSN